MKKKKRNSKKRVTKTYLGKAIRMESETSGEFSKRKESAEKPLVVSKFTKKYYGGMIDL